MLDLLNVASLELADVGAWYDERVVGLGDRFLDEPESAFSLIEENPEVGSCYVVAVEEDVRVNEDQGGHRDSRG